MTTLGKNILILLSAVAAVALLMLAPVARQAVEGILGTPYKDVSMFDIENYWVIIAGIVVSVVWILAVIFVLIWDLAPCRLLSKLFPLAFVVVVGFVGKEVLGTLGADAQYDVFQVKIGDVSLNATTYVSAALAALAAGLSFIWMRKGTDEEEDVYKPLK